MMWISEVKKSLIKLLNNCFRNVHVFTEDISQISNEREDAFPLFHIQLVLLDSRLCMGADASDNTLLVDITYMDSQVSTNSKMYEVYEKVREKIAGGIYVADRFIHVENVAMQIADDLLHITFQVVLNIAFPDGVTYEKFENIDIDL